MKIIQTIFVIASDVSLGFAGLLLTSLRLQCVKSWMSLTDHPALVARL
jgi:hypothetical protein